MTVWGIGGVTLCIFHPLHYRNCSSDRHVPAGLRPGRRPCGLQRWFGFFEEQKEFCPCRDSNLDSLVVQHIAWLVDRPASVPQSVVCWPTRFGNCFNSTFCLLLTRSQNCEKRLTSRVVLSLRLLCGFSWNLIFEYSEIYRDISSCIKIR